MNYLKGKRKIELAVDVQPSTYGADYIGLPVYEFDKDMNASDDISHCIHRYTGEDQEKARWLYSRGSKSTLGVCYLFPAKSRTTLTEIKHIVYITEGFIDAYTLAQHEIERNPIDHTKRYFISPTTGVTSIFSDKFLDKWIAIFKKATNIKIILDNDVAGKEAIINGVKWIADNDLWKHGKPLISWSISCQHNDLNECYMDTGTVCINTLFFTKYHTQKEKVSLSSLYLNMKSHDKKLVDKEFYNKLAGLTAYTTKRNPIAYDKTLTIKTKITDIIPLLNTRKNIRCPNPEHNDKEPSCGLIHNVKTNDEILHCFGCNKSWNVVTLYAMIHNITTKEAFKILNQY